MSMSQTRVVFLATCCVTFAVLRAWLQMRVEHHAARAGCHKHNETEASSLRRSTDAHHRAIMYAAMPTTAILTASPSLPDVSVSVISGALVGAAVG